MVMTMTTTRTGFSAPVRQDAWQICIGVEALMAAIFWKMGQILARSSVAVAFYQRNIQGNECGIPHLTVYII